MSNGVRIVFDAGRLKGRCVAHARPERRKVRAMHSKNKIPACRDMDGAMILRGDRAICFALPERQPCIVRILEILDSGRVRATNGRMESVVPSDSCILQAHSKMAL